MQRCVRGQHGRGQGHATEFCPRGVLEVEASPRGPHPCMAVFMTRSVHCTFLQARTGTSKRFHGCVGEFDE